MSGLVTAVELICREIARPKARVEGSQPIETVQLKELSRNDVSAILQRERGASAEELQHILADAKQYGLSGSEREQLSVDLTIAISQARQNNGRPHDPSERFLCETLGLCETPFGLVERSFIEDLLRVGSRDFTSCRLHRPPRCGCWAAQRESIWNSQIVYGLRSPEGWAATKAYEILDSLELSRRSEMNDDISSI